MHSNSFSESYAAAGVDITAGYKAVELMKKHVARTRNEGCLDDVGGFGGCFGLNIAGMEEPVLVSGTDGVGTKLKLAILTDKHDTIGIDCVAMCVNDVICVGAKPLFFLDYIACGKNVPERIAELVAGVAEGCVQSGCALIGGETAEHPGMMPEDEYDLAGFTVGVVDKKKIIDNTKMKAGDVIIALPSTGIHSNGFSLCRKVFDIDNNNPDLYVPREELGEKTVAEALLVPTKIYVKPVLALLEKVNVKGISHITGGGFYENIPRSIPDGLCANVDRSAVKVLPIFDVIAKDGNIPERDMFNTYNMGVGMSIIVAPEDVDTALEVLKANGEDAYVIGSISEGSEKIVIA
ncbi:MAG: phosphoribosylformylglycinamidine cyclo-ligase [Clostridia bacterium]|nr:phosphoribosylformylglycinamidine cyclo-ligase [Clostridia bacterium]